MSTFLYIRFTKQAVRQMNDELAVRRELAAGALAAVVAGGCDASDDRQRHNDAFGTSWEDFACAA
ncbi:MAG: hypothetical protein U0610_29085 [bacterium]